MILLILMTRFSQSNTELSNSNKSVFGSLFFLLLFTQSILYKAVLLTVVEKIPGRDVDEVCMFFRSLENEISSISVEKSLNMQNCQDMLWTDYYSQ